MKYLKYIFIIITLIAVSCKSEKSEKNTTSKVEETTSQPQQKQITYIEVQPDASQKFHTIGDEIDIALNFHADIKSIYYKVKCNDEVIDSVSTKQTTYKWHSAKQGKAGENELTFAIEENGKLQEASINVILLPKEAPRQLSYKIINTYPHDREAYTQGLFFKDNFFYEATGLKGESSVRKVKPETGQVLRSFAVATDIFGEGITSFDDKIIQLSWQAGRGFVYRMSDFKLLNEFQYQGEGWGIDYHNNKLYMTDGTNTIKILDDQNFITIAEIKVFDNKGAVNYLHQPRDGHSGGVCEFCRFAFATRLPLRYRRAKRHRIRQSPKQNICYG